MSGSRWRTAGLVALGVLGFLSLRPGTAVERGFELLLLPARFAGELARPFELVSGLFAGRGARAAETALAGEALAVAERSRELLGRAQSAALPADEALRQGRGFLHAQVVERSAATPDFVTLQFDPSAAVAVGHALAAGDVYVGRVARLSRTRAGEAEARLVTERGFRVGAEMLLPDGRRGALVVGGLVPPPEYDPRGLYLAVHSPDLRDAAMGEVRVRELSAAREVSGGSGARESSTSALADGFLLGTLVRYDVDGVTVRAVRAPLDLAAGPHELVVVVEAERAEAGPPLARDPFAPERWIHARAVVPGEASAGREARRLLVGTRAGVEPGAAVCVAGALAGRIEHAGAWSSAARLLGDPGFAVLAMADIGADAPPMALGRIVALGRGDGDRIVFAWENTVDPLSAAGDGAGVPRTRAELFTGSGERTVPAGLHIGTAELVRARGRQLLLVEPRVDVRDAVRMRVWRAALPRVEEP